MSEEKKMNQSAFTELNEEEAEKVTGGTEQETETGESDIPENPTPFKPIVIMPKIVQFRFTCQNCGHIVEEITTNLAYQPGNCTKCGAFSWTQTIIEE